MKMRGIDVEAGEGCSSFSDAQLGQLCEVFLNFKGTDTEGGFIDQLCHALGNAGVGVFRDSEKRHVGESIGLQLIEGIRQSKISIPIFSRNYASSTWCLEEFGLMMECRKTMNQKVLPIFYDITPNEVEHQTGKFEEAFDEHLNQYGASTVQKWRNALSEVGSLKGWESQNLLNGHEAELVESVVAEVRRILNKGNNVLVKDTVVGLEEQINAVMELLEVNQPDIRIVGIWGIGGIGKTTLANIIYNQISDQFDSCCILENIREKALERNGLESLQSMLAVKLAQTNLQEFPTITKELKDRLSGKKVLILLNDIDHRRQLDALGAGIGSFRQGSRIIVTTRECNLLDKSRDRIYAVKEMQHDQALRLFCRHAFKAESPTAELSKMSDDIVNKIGGLPLALKVIGGYLAGQEKAIWESVLEKLQKIPQKEIDMKLMIIYEALTEEQKYIFKDISCFYIGEDVRIASYIWKDRFQFSPARDIDVLCSSLLIKIGDDNILGMHDQLRDLGRAIIEQENNDPVGKRIWLWRNNDAMDLLRERKGSSKVEALNLDGHLEKDNILTAEQFKELPNLRFMRLYNFDLAGNFQDCLSNLKWLGWNNSSVMSSMLNLSLTNLVVLNLSKSEVGDDWKWCSTQVAPKLKALDLSWCEGLTRTPDFSLFPNLEKLNLSRCSKLVAVDSSIGNLKSLTYLNLGGCQGVEELPHQMSALISLVELDVSLTSIKDIPLSGDMEKLQTLNAELCFHLSGLPNCIGGLASLRELKLNVSGITELPESIGKLTALVELKLDLTGITELPESIGQLTSLIELSLTRTSISALPESIGNLRSLERLDIKWTCIKCLPSSLGKLENLRLIDASGFESFEGEIPADIGKLSHLEVLKIKADKICSLPATITSLSCLHTLHLDFPTWVPPVDDDDDHAGSDYYYPDDYIPSLETLPELPVSLTSVVISCKSMLPIPNLSHLTNLKELAFRSCVGMVEIPQDISNLPKLEKLGIGYCAGLSCIHGTLPTNLCKLYVSHCSSLVVIQGLECLKSLKILYVSCCDELHKLEGLEELNELSILSCGAIDKLEGLSSLKLLKKLDASGCEKLQDLEKLDGLEALESLDISGCKAIQRLPNLLNLKWLRWLVAGDCENLQNLEGLDGGLEALESLDISRCRAMEKLPNLSNLKRLKHLRSMECENLQDLEGLDRLETLEILNISGCKAIERLPNLSNLKRLTWLDASDCKSLQDLEGLDGLDALEGLNISRCAAIERLPDVSNLESLRWLQAQD